MAYTAQFPPKRELSKAEMVRDMIASGRCFYHQVGAPGLELIERRSTAILLQPNDFLVVGKLAKKSDEAVHYPLSESDLPIIRGLSDMRKDEYARNNYTYIVLAFYLYLADLVTIYPNKKKWSFLQGCREAGFLDEDDKRPTKEKLIQALKLLHIYKYQHVAELVEEWDRDGTFKVEGLSGDKVPEEQDVFQDKKKVKSKGVYSTLARVLARNKPEGEFSPVIHMANCIAYALSVKGKVEHIDDHETRKIEVLRHAELASKFTQFALHAARDGHELRDKQITILAEERANKLVTGYDKGKEIKFFEEILSSLSEQVISVFYTTSYELVYSEETSLRGVYPKEDLPGLKDTECKTSRNAKGLNLSRYRMALFSSDTLDIGLSEEDRFLKFRHSLSHEALHNALGVHVLINQDLPDIDSRRRQKIEILYKAGEVFSQLVKAQTEEIKPLLDTKLPSIGFTLRECLDFKLYAGYTADPENKTVTLVQLEEMLCNLYGLSQVEFREKEGANALNSNHPELAQLQELSRELQDLVSNAVKSQKDYQQLQAGKINEKA